MDSRSVNNSVAHDLNTGLPCYKSIKKSERKFSALSTKPFSDLFVLLSYKRARNVCV